MKNIYRIVAIVLLISISLQMEVIAGNDKRRGTAGGYELLINPWARSAGWGGVNTSTGKGIDALYTNVAGLAFTKRTELQYSYTSWLQGAGVGINAAGLAQRLGASGVLAISFMAMSYEGEHILKEDSPEKGDNGMYAPSNMNIAVAYSHSFSSSIHGGASIKVITEGTDNVSATGIALDAGIQYVTGENDEMKFGVALKNVGPAMQFDGAGLSRLVKNAKGRDVTMEFSSALFELPTLLNIGASYDFLFQEVGQRFTIAGNFTSNAFGRDKYILGGEYAFLSIFQLRAGYIFEEDIFSSTNRATFLTGFSAGLSVEAPLGKKDLADEKKIIPMLKIDYSYRTTEFLGGIHTVGIGLGL